MSRTVIIRAVLSAISLFLYGWLNVLLRPAAALISADAAGRQFDNSNTSLLASVAGMHFGVGFGISLGVLLVVLVLIWLPVLRRRDVRRLPPVVAALSVLLSAHPAFAYYDKNDFAEAYFILPNESAFFIPDIGANKDSQAKFGSTEYLDASKVAAKRFIIPHGKLPGSGSWADFYVPTGRLIIVDRTPYNREWVAAHDRGTSTRNESFPCQSQEGLNVTVEVAIAASVSEEDAARFLYWFGVRPPSGNRADPQVIFTSVYNGRSLAEVMDSVGRGKVQSLACHEIGARPFDKVNGEINLIMEAVDKNASAFFKSRGITIDYIGWAGSFTYDKDVQQAVNDRYTAEKIAPVLSVLQARVALETMIRWDGRLPTTVSGLWVLPPDVWSILLAWLKPNMAPK